MENYKKEEWGAWKIVSDMLDNPNEGIYPTSKCYQKLYDFVCKQKEKAKQEERERILKELDNYGISAPRVECLILNRSTFKVLIEKDLNK